MALQQSPTKLLLRRANCFALVARDRANLLAAEAASVSTPRLFEQLPRHPIITGSAAMKLINVSKPTASLAVESLADVNILVETTGKKRDRSFAYRAYLEHLRTGTGTVIAIR
jgi:hypothetical protein